MNNSASIALNLDGMYEADIYENGCWARKCGFRFIKDAKEYCKQNDVAEEDIEYFFCD